PSSVFGRKLSAPPSIIEPVFEVTSWNGSSELWPGARGTGREVISVCGEQEPASVAEALSMLDRALVALAAADVGSLPTPVQAQALRALERAEARHTAVGARFLAAFTAQDGYEDDGQGSARMWLRWQTRVTGAAAASAVGWMRRLAVHPVIAAALAEGQISVSWARAVCGWSDRLPAGMRGDADQILVEAAAGGAELAGLAGLGQQMYERSRSGEPDGDDDGFDDRRLLLDLTFAGAGRLTGDLTPGCAAAVSAVLEALGKPAGPEDLRTVTQRRHDALEEACRRLIAAKMVPGRAGQPTQALVHMGLGQLRDLPGAADAEAAWTAGRAHQQAWLRGAEAAAAPPAAASFVPIVTGRADPAALDRLTEAFPAGEALSRGSRRRLRSALLALAADALSGPGGLAARLRAGLDGPLATVSLPLDIGPASETIPAHLRRAVIARHGHCAFPGCEQPTGVCEVHHLIPRSEGGTTALHNLVPLCTFHHLVVIHRWGWTLTLHPDGTTTATSPDGRGVFHGHGPPGHGPPGHGPPA